jgi:alpha,alpha-trehalose phosphorylase
MAQQNLFAAVEAAKRHPDLARKLGVDDEEMASWRDAAAAVHIPYDRELGVHQQSEGFTRLQEWDFENTPPEAYPLLLNYPYFDLYRKQVVKQADLVMAMYIRGDSFTPEEKARNFAYYEARTVRDSSLSACVQAVMAAETGHLELAHDYLGEAALMDLHDLHQNARDGVHVASLAGSWIALVAGLGGMRDFNGQLSFAPRLPSRISSLEFSLLWRGLRLRVNVTSDEVTYSLRNGGGSARLTVIHHGKEVEVTQVKPVTVPNPPPPPVGPPPVQPTGRAPARRAFHD